MTRPRGKILRWIGLESFSGRGSLGIGTPVNDAEQGGFAVLVRSPEEEALDSWFRQE